MDLFERLDLLPAEVRQLIEDHFANPDNQGMNYEGCQDLLNKLEPHGYTFAWGLDGEPYNLIKSEDLTTIKFKQNERA